MFVSHKAIDLLFNKPTVIIENSYGFEILGQDGSLYNIDRCTAYASIIKYIQENDKITKKD